jgi:hypothetical protein
MGLDGVELIMAVEREFDIEITQDDANRLRTVADFHELVLAKIPDAASLDPSVWVRLVRVISEEQGISPARILPAARLVADLGIN